jgi:hypothetical protein
MTQYQKDRLELGLQFIKLVGVPTFVLSVILYWLGAATDRLHDSVLVPAMTSHTQFLKATVETQERQAVALEKLTDNRVQQTQILEEIAAGQQEILERISPRRAVGAAE